MKPPSPAIRKAIVPAATVAAASTRGRQVASRPGHGAQQRQTGRERNDDGDDRGHCAHSAITDACATHLAAAARPDGATGGGTSGGHFTDSARLRPAHGAAHD